MKRVLVIDNRDSFVYNIVEYLRRTGEAETDVVCDDGRTQTPCAEEYDGIVLSPGAGVPEEYAMMRALLADGESGGRKMLGVCLGMQAMVEATGGRLRRLDAPKHGHPSRLHFCGEREGMFAAVKEGSTVGRYHSWVVERESLPECWSVVAEDEEGNIMILTRRDAPWTAVQFHPESIISEEGYEMIRGWVESL